MGLRGKIIESRQTENGLGHKHGNKRRQQKSKKIGTDYGLIAKTKKEHLLMVNLSSIQV